IPAIARVRTSATIITTPAVFKPPTSRPSGRQSFCSSRHRGSNPSSHVGVKPTSRPGKTDRLRAAGCRRSLKRTVRPASFLMVLEFRKQFHPMETSRLNHVPQNGEREEQRLKDHGDQYPDNASDESSEHEAEGRELPPKLSHHLGSQLIRGRGQRGGRQAKCHQPCMRENVTEPRRAFQQP